MFAALAVLFLVVPFLELFVLLQVGQAIGVLDTIGLLVLVSIVGAWLVKREGLGVLQRAQGRLRVLSGGDPSRRGPFPTGRPPCLPPAAGARKGIGLRPMPLS